MTNDILTNSLIENYVSNPKDKVVLHTLQFSDSLFLVSDFQNHDLPIENGDIKTFKSCPFILQLPHIDIYENTELSIQVDNVDRSFVIFFDEMLDNYIKIDVFYRPYISRVISYTRPLKLTLTDIEVTKYKLIAKAKYISIKNKRFPIKFYNDEEFPFL